jgi:YD repeat-containing protein
MKLFNLVLLSLLLSGKAFAIVDMKNANFSSSWTDLIVPGSGYDLKVVRTYNSRSLFNGLFGFGWCSDFETKLNVLPDGNLKVIECGGGMELLYTPRGFNQKDIDKVISQIVAKSREKAKQSDAYFDSLAKSLKTDSKLRTKLANEFGLKGDVKEGLVYLANGKEVENITFAKNAYTRKLSDGSSQKFDNLGRMVLMYDKNGNYLKLGYDKQKLKEVEDNNSRKLVFKYNSNQQLTTISGPTGVAAEYKFASLDHLSWVNNSWGNVYTFEYDDLHNMTKATWPDKSSVQLTYDKTKDWVMSFKDRLNCTEQYVYEVGKDDPKNHYWSNVKKTCNKEVVSESKFEFFHKVRADGVTYLHRTVTSINNNITDIIYHEDFGKPLSIRRNSEKVTFDYYPNGLLRTKTANLAKNQYDYDSSSNKVSKVKTIFNDEKGKKIAEKTSEFKYDTKGNLTFAKNSDGQKINLAYDLKGRIASIEDQAKKVVKIQYEEKFGKPAIVTRPQLGTIKISYKQNGDIDKAESPDGPQVAMQVASTFNNLLDIIAPATAEVFN